MTFRLRHNVIAVATGLLLFCISCEKHPLPETRGVQEEQVDAEKARETHSEKSSSSPTPAEFFPTNPRP
jgi:hypothetical protein